MDTTSTTSNPNDASVQPGEAVKPLVGYERITLNVRGNLDLTTALGVQPESFPVSLPAKSANARQTMRKIAALFVGESLKVEVRDSTSNRVALITPKDCTKGEWQYFEGESTSATLIDGNHGLQNGKDKSGTKISRYDSALGLASAIMHLYGKWYPTAKGTSGAGFHKSALTVLKETLETLRGKLESAIDNDNFADAKLVKAEITAVKAEIAAEEKRKADEASARKSNANSAEITTTPPMGETPPTPPTPPTSDLSEAALKTEAEKRASTNA